MSCSGPVRLARCWGPRSESAGASGGKAVRIKFSNAPAGRISFLLSTTARKLAHECWHALPDTRDQDRRICRSTSVRQSKRLNRLLELEQTLDNLPDMDQDIWLHEAMRLPPVQRALLADALLVSLDDEASREVESAWATVAEERLAAYRRGEVEASDGAAVLGRWRAGCASA